METNENRRKQMSVPADNNDYTRRNRFTGESIELTKEECEMFYITYYAKKHKKFIILTFSSDKLFVFLCVVSYVKHFVLSVVMGLSYKIIPYVSIVNLHFVFRIVVLP